MTNGSWLNRVSLERSVTIKHGNSPGTDLSSSVFYGILAMGLQTTASKFDLTKPSFLPHP